MVPSADMDAFSAASGRGLIEAACSSALRAASTAFSAASGRGLIEAKPRHIVDLFEKHVFRGIGPRPH